MQNISIAILIPCYNEEQTITDMVSKYKQSIPHAHIYVYDNNSQDKTVEYAQNSGAIVRHVKERGKGNVVNRMFSDIDADVYVLIDGDMTYNIDDTKQMIDKLLEERLDMVVAARKSTVNEGSFRFGHKTGNYMYNLLIKVLFGGKFNDIFSGFRVFSKRFVKTFPVTSRGFDIEAEMTIHAISMNVPYAEIESEYYCRPPGSHSKLNTIRDGIKVLITLLSMLKENRPLFFYIPFSLVFGLITSILVYKEQQIGYCIRDYREILSTIFFGVMSLLSFTCGIIANSIKRARYEIKKLRYLKWSA